MRRRGGRGPAYVVCFMNLALCGDFTVFEECATSKLCLLGIQHMFGPHMQSDGGCPLAPTHAVSSDIDVFHLWARLVHHYFLLDNERG